MHLPNKFQQTVEIILWHSYSAFTFTCWHLSPCLSCFLALMFRAWLHNHTSSPFFCVPVSNFCFFLISHTSLIMFTSYLHLTPCFSACFLSTPCVMKCKSTGSSVATFLGTDNLRPSYNSIVYCVSSFPYDTYGPYQSSHKPVKLFKPYKLSCWSMKQLAKNNIICYKKS